MRAILDNNLPWRIAAALHVLVEPDGHEVRHLRQKFPESTPDAVWLRQLGDESGWVVISGDMRILRNRHEREVWRQAGLVAFFLARGWLKARYLEQAYRLIQWWPQIVEQAALVEAGAAFEVPLRLGSGKFRQLRT